MELSGTALYINITIFQKNTIFFYYNNAKKKWLEKKTKEGRYEKNVDDRRARERGKFFVIYIWAWIIESPTSRLGRYSKRCIYFLASSWREMRPLVTVS